MSAAGQGDPVSPQFLVVDGVRVPSFMYGTAWKEEATEALVEHALRAGFRAIDSANQRRHYHEAGVGAALERAEREGLIERDALFLQTKFTYRAGQDERLPYDPEAAPRSQVRQSFDSSLQHLKTDHLDVFMLHGPSTAQGLDPVDYEVWSEMEAIQRQGGSRFLGVSNVSLEQLERLCEHSEIAPRFVQNRCFARRGWDREVRAFCRRNDLIYQGFSLLTANARELAPSPVFQQIVDKSGLAPAQVVFRFALQLGMQPLTGTTDPAHMAEDIGVLNHPGLDAEELDAIENLARV